MSARLTRAKTASAHLTGGSFYDPANCEADATVYDGQLVRGFLIDEPRQCAALTPDRFLIGLFPDRKAATQAIFTNRGSAA